MSAPTTNASETASDRKCHGLIYTWGFCTHGQLGLKESVLGAREYVETPTHAGAGSVLRDVELRSAACGHFHTLAVDLKGNVYAFGRNDRGQLGRGGDDCEEVAAGTGFVPRRVLSLKRVIITDVVSGAFHCLARTADGWMISWGWNKHGQLGRHTAYQSDSTPEPVREAKDSSGAIRSFTAGFSHSAAVLHSGQVLAWGSNEYGQLGVGPAIRHPEVASAPFLVPELIGEQVAAGDNHLLILTIDGQVFAAGDASYGRLGIGLENPKKAKERAGRCVMVQNLPWSEDYSLERIRSVSAGGATSAAISTQGRLLTWGGGVWGQLGVGSRIDHDAAVVVSSLQDVSQVSIAQDHMLAICCKDSSSTSTTLWGWGRRQLLPSGILSKDVDPEAECLPAEITLDALGCLEDLRSKGAIGNVHAVCGGSHSMIVGVPSTALASDKHFAFARCPQFSTVTGPGTKGGVVSDLLSFRIISRNADGRDETVGGLRFCIWANAISEAKPRRSIGKGDLSLWDKHPFELKHVIDCCNGTYDGAYVIRKTGAYYLHVHMLGRDEEVEMNADFSKTEPGDPVKGSPFRIQIDSGRACARNCVVELRGVKRRRDEARPDAAITGGTICQKQNFTIEASSEATWDILAYDIFNNFVTHKLDRFSIWIERDEEDLCEVDSASFDVDLADSMGLPKLSVGRSSAGDALRERVRQRKAEKIWTRMTNTFTQALGVSSASASLHGKQAKIISLQVRQTKELGRKEVRWTPDAVGSYELKVALVGDDDSNEELIANSPFHVRVVPGKTCPSNSRLLVGEDAIRVPGMAPPSIQTGASTNGLVQMSGEDHPEAHVPMRLLLCDRMGNVCQEMLNALNFINVRIESVYLPGSDIPEESSKKYLESSVSPTASKGLLMLGIRATPQLLDTLATAHAHGGIRNTCTLMCFVAASDSASREHLLGSPCRLRVEIPSSCWASVSVALPTNLFRSSDCSTAKTTIETDDNEEPTNFDVETIIQDIADVNHSSLEDAPSKKHELEQQDQLPKRDIMPLHSEDSSEDVIALQPIASAEIAVLASVPCRSRTLSSFEIDMCDHQSEKADGAREKLKLLEEKLKLLEPLMLPSGSRDDSSFHQREDRDSLCLPACGICGRVPCLCIAPKDSPCGIDSQASTEASENVCQSEELCVSSSISFIESKPETLPQAMSLSDLTSGNSPKPRLEGSGSSPDTEHMAVPLKLPMTLPSPSNGLTCPVRTPPAEREILERRSHVQLPPISPVSRNASSVQISNATSEKHEPLLSAVSTQENNASTHPLPHDVATSCSGKGLGRTNSSREHSVSKLSPSIAPAMDKKLRAQAETQLSNDRRRRTSSTPSGLPTRIGSFKAAPSPWPQARTRS